MTESVAAKAMRVVAMDRKLRWDKYRPIGYLPWDARWEVARTARMIGEHDAIVVLSAHERPAREQQEAIRKTWANGPFRL